jgi:hypothetical protein
VPLGASQTVTTIATDAAFLRDLIWSFVAKVVRHDVERERTIVDIDHGKLPQRAFRVKNKA